MYYIGNVTSVHTTILRTDDANAYINIYTNSGFKVTLMLEFPRAICRMSHGIQQYGNPVGIPAKGNCKYYGVRNTVAL